MPVCPVCMKNSPEVIIESRSGTMSLIICPLCGKFSVSDRLKVTLLNNIEYNIENRTKLSFSIRQMQKENQEPILEKIVVDKIINKSLPSVGEQIDLLIRWLVESSTGPGSVVKADEEKHRTIVGAQSKNNYLLLLNYLVNMKLIECDTSQARYFDIVVTVDGLLYYEKLKTKSVSYHKAFMAMKYGNNTLDQIVENVFKPSVKSTGFELIRLDDEPRAGSIDDRLRVEIKTSDFLIADLSDDNLGAYWEAGYAEGLGKPVIYTCEENRFENQSTHFDTNHHLTIKWNTQTPDECIEKLKATIRATLPHLAKMKD